MFLLSADFTRNPCPESRSIPGVEVNPTSPPAPSMIALEIASPSPVPWANSLSFWKRQTLVPVILPGYRLRNLPHRSDSFFRCCIPFYISGFGAFDSVCKIVHPYLLEPASIQENPTVRTGIVHLKLNIRIGYLWLDHGIKLVAYFG